MEEEKIIYKYEIDNDNYFTGNYCTLGSFLNYIERDSLLEETDINKIKATKYDFDTDTLIFDEEKYNSSLQAINDKKSRQEKINEINSLKVKLASTDYKVIKCAECSVTGEEMPYDVEELHSERQSLRDRINELEEQLI